MKEIKVSKVPEEFYSLAPKYRTKKKLQEMIDKELHEKRVNWYQVGFEEGLNKANEDEQYIKYRK
jgi:flagellar biosynthesis/type III secretory pathway protein FliH